MENHLHHIDELIAKRLAGETTAVEAGMLEQWLSESPENLRYFSQMQQLWQRAEQARVELPRPLDVEAALARTKAKIRRTPEKGKAKVVSIGSWRFAAAAAVVLLAAAIWFFRTPTVEPVQLAARETPLNDTLADGSVVALNHHSNLSVVLGAKDRRVKMGGEAYFKVAKNPEKPFIIEVKQVEITVLGTQFNVDNRRDSTKVVVTVEEGRVRVQRGSQVIFLGAGEQAVIDCNSGQITRSTVTQTSNIKGWIDHRFVFDDVPLSEVVAILSKAYDVPIELNNKALGDCRLRARFNDEPIDRIINVIAETFSLEITHESDRYMLNGAGCGQ